MRKFEITFWHIEKTKYVAEIEAETKDEAMEIFDESPFDCVKNLEGEETQGLDIENESCKEIK